MKPKRFVLEGGETQKRNRLLGGIGALMSAPIMLFGQEETQFIGVLLIFAGIGLVVMAFADKANFLLATKKGLNIKIGSDKALIPWADIRGYDLRNGRLYIFTEETQFTIPRTYFKLNQDKKVLRFIADELSERNLSVQKSTETFW